MAQPFCQATLAEREHFYQTEFSIQKLSVWFTRKPQLCALDPGTETGIAKNKNLRGTLLYFYFSELQQKIKKYGPEDVYYDRNIYLDADKHLKHLDRRAFFSDANVLGQEIVFDIDADNIPCRHSKGVLVCMLCLTKAYRVALAMKKELEKQFSSVRLVYSGRGFHVHVQDKPSYFLTHKQRTQLNKKFSRFPIDSWVSGGSIELVRLPYSLNALISRVVTPLDSKKFTEKIGIPMFLKEKGD